MARKPIKQDPPIVDEASGWLGNEPEAEPEVEGEDAEPEPEPEPKAAKPQARAAKQEPKAYHVAMGSVRVGGGVYHQGETVEGLSEQDVKDYLASGVIAEGAAPKPYVKPSKAGRYRVLGPGTMLMGGVYYGPNCDAGDVLPQKLTAEDAAACQVPIELIG